ncbi:hypothetical protein D9M68_893700 [compost metagenome]
MCLTQAFFEVGIIETKKSGKLGDIGTDNKVPLTTGNQQSAHTWLQLQLLECLVQLMKSGVVQFVYWAIATIETQFGDTAVDRQLQTDSVKDHIQLPII